MCLQIRHAREAATALKLLVQRLHVALCVTHGNGPQIGLLALQARAKTHLLNHICSYSGAMTDL